MSASEFPPPFDEDGAKKPWHKPTMHILTDMLNTWGAPTLKVDTPPVTYEDESLKTPSPEINAGKNYRPITV